MSIRTSLIPIFSNLARFVGLIAMFAFHGALD
jgi:hypothetical protein